MDEANGLVVGKGLGVRAVGKQSREFFVKFLEASLVGGVELVKRLTDTYVVLDDVPTCAEKLGRKPSGRDALPVGTLLTARQISSSMKGASSSERSKESSRSKDWLIEKACSPTEPRMSEK